MAVMLRGEELVLRREWARQRAGVKQPAIGCRIWIEILVRVGERYHDLTLRERRQDPVEAARAAKSDCGQTGLHDFTTSHSSVGHESPLYVESDGFSRPLTRRGLKPSPSNDAANTSHNDCCSSIPASSA